MNRDFNIMFLDENDQVWFSEEYTNFQLKEKDNKIEILQLDLDREKSIAAEYGKRLIKAINHIKEYCIDDEFYVNLTNKEKNIIEVLDILEGKDYE